MKTRRVIILSFAIVALAAGGAGADFVKTKIAVLDFQLQGEGHQTEDMGKIVAEWLVTAFVNEGRFAVIERSMLEKILAEQKLMMSGLLDQSSAVQLGKLLGVKAIISGSVMKLQSITEVNARIIDVQDASIIAAERVRSSTTIRLEDLVVEMAQKLIQDFPLEGYVVKREADGVVIDLGSRHGVKKGMRFVVFREGSKIKHPKTGEVLDIEKIPTGVVEITGIGSKIASARIVSEEQPDGIAYGNFVKSSSELRESPIGSLVVNTVPEAARVRILNIVPRYRRGMSLEPGRYKIEVSAEGFQPKIVWARVAAGEDAVIDITLDPGVSETAPRTADVPPAPKIVKAPPVASTTRVPPVVAAPPATPAVPPPPAAETAPPAGRRAPTDETIPATFTNTLEMEFVYIPPGSFSMGSPLSDPERKSDEIPHRVTLRRGYYLQTTEVTQKQWTALMGRNPSNFQYIMTNTDDRPVESVSWEDAIDFIHALNQAERTDKYRLPTEAEWEYAARAGTSTIYSWGDQPDCARMVYATRTATGSWDREECNKPFRARGLPRGATSPVKSMPPNPWGLYDMNGNVWEWVSDWYGEFYTTDPQTDPVGPGSGTLHVFRGGSWDRSGRETRSANRLWDTPNSITRKTPSFRSPERGFRVARTP